MNSWRPATILEVKKMVSQQLPECNPQQLAAFKQFGVEPHFATICRYGKMEEVVVVARKDSEVIYWEDIDEGFNISPISPEGTILEHWSNQDDLPTALTALIQRLPTVKVRPAR